MQIYFVILLFFFILSNNIYANSYNLKDILNGYINITRIHTTGSEFYTDGYLDLALRFNYRFNNKLFFATQVLSRNKYNSSFNDIFTENLNLDYFLLNFTPYQNNRNVHNFQIGKIKVPIGFYNESRDVPFTRPSPILPDSVYSFKLRKLFLSADGGMYKYSRYNNKYNIEFTYGLGYPTTDEYFISNFFPTLLGIIEVEPELSQNITLALSTNNLRHRLKYSYVKSTVKSTNLPTELDMNYSLYSYQYNRNKFSWTSELGITDLEIKNGIDSVVTGWYTQLEYFLTPKLSALIRYEDLTVDLDTNIMRGEGYDSRVLNLKYSLMEDVNLNLYFSNNDGLFPLMPLDLDTGQPLKIQDKWNLYMISMDYKF